VAKEEIGKRRRGERYRRVVPLESPHAGRLEVATATAAVETGAAEDGNMEHKAIDAVTGADVSDGTFEIGAGMASLYHGTIVEDASDDEDVQSGFAGQRSDGYEVESDGESDCRDEMDESCQCNENIAHSLDFGCGKWAIDASQQSDTWEFQAGRIRDGSDAHLADGWDAAASRLDGQNRQ
jgi:hypothetical protein